MHQDTILSHNSERILIINSCNLPFYREIDAKGAKNLLVYVDLKTKGSKELNEELFVKVREALAPAETIEWKLE